MVSFRSRIVRMISAYYMKSVYPGQDVQLMRRGLDRRGSILPPASGVDVQPTIINGVDCEWHVPAGCNDAPIIYYLHGGAYMMGSPTSHRRLVSFIARESGMRALVPDYSVAPEHKFPVALEQSLGIYRELLNGGIDAGSMAIGGDSAGGNLATATLLALRDAGDPLPRAGFLMSPWLDMTGEGETNTTRADVDPWFKPQYITAAASEFCTDFDRKNPLVSPVFADASGLPPLLIQVGDDEILQSDSISFAENIRKAGGQVELKVWDGMWHVFQFFVGQMPESKRAIDDIGRFLRSKYSKDRIDMQKGQAA